MAHYPKVTLEQWRTLQAVVDHGGFAQAANKLHRSQSAVSYTIARLQEQVGTPLLKIDGRKAILTETGELLLQRSRRLLQQANELEDLARQLTQGREAEVRLVVDAAFPSDILMRSLKQFARQDHKTQIQLHEVILSGARESLENNTADLVIGAELPDGWLADPLLHVEFVAVAHPQHPLHHGNQPVLTEQLAEHIHVVIRDSGLSAPIDRGWLGHSQRWTVSSIDTAITAIRHGLGFGWLPLHLISDDLLHGRLRALNLQQGGSYFASLYLLFAHQQNSGPATRELASIIQDCVAQQTSTSTHQPGRVV